MTRCPSSGSSPVVSVSRMIWRIASPRALGHLGAAQVGELVGALVALVAGVAFDPKPLDVVLGGDLVQAPPQVLVLDRFLVGGAPAVLLPLVDPAADAEL